MYIFWKDYKYLCALFGTLKPKYVSINGTFRFFNWQNSFLAKTFLWMHFLQRSNLHFWNQNEKTDFLTPHSPYLKKKKFSSLRRDNEYLVLFEKWKVKNARYRSIFKIGFFYKQVLHFVALSKFYATHRSYEILSKPRVPTL